MPLTKISEDAADQLYEHLVSAVETAIETEEQSFYQLSLASGVDQSVLSRARQRTFKLNTDNLLSVLQSVFADETRDYARKIKAAARKRPA
jgi:hypothetical protein